MVCLDTTINKYFVTKLVQSFEINFIPPCNLCSIAHHDVVCWGAGAIEWMQGKKK